MLEGALSVQLVAIEQIRRGGFAIARDRAEPHLTYAIVALAPHTLFPKSIRACYSIGYVAGTTAGYHDGVAIGADGPARRSHVEPRSSAAAALTSELEQICTRT